MQDGKRCRPARRTIWQNFSKTYGIQFQARDLTNQFAWGTSWGVSTRLVGMLIMTHADDLGMIVPPALAPVQVVVVPIYKTDDEAKALFAECTRIAAELAKVGVRAKAYLRDNLRPGNKFFEWEKKGVPVRLAIGPRDLAARTIEMKRRTATDPKAKECPARARRFPGISNIQPRCLSGAYARSRTFTSTLRRVQDALEGGGFFHLRWCGARARRR